MSIYELSEAQARLPEILSTLIPGEQITILSDGKILATLTREAAPNGPRKPGSAANTPHWMAPDFDAPLEEFREYTE